MPNTVRIKRSTASAAPTTLQNAELAYSENSDRLFIGVGTGGAGGSATSIVAIGGKGSFVDLATAQTVAGVKTFSASPIVPTPTTSGQAATKGYVDSITPSIAAGSGISTSVAGVTVTVTADSTIARLASPTFTGVPAGPTAVANTNTTQLATTAFVVGQAATVAPLMDGTAAIGTSLLYARQDHVHATDTSRAPVNSPTFTGTVTIPAGASISGFAPLASPALTGVPTAPTAAAGTNTTQVATTAFVSTAVANLVSAAPAALDTLNELAAALGNDANFATTISTSIGTKLTTANNLSELTATASTARTNLGLGSIATQAASNVSITGGSITNLSTFDGVTIDGGTF